MRPEIDSARIDEVLQWLEAGDMHYVRYDLRVDSPTAAAILGIAPGTLRNWRAAGKGPTAYHLGRVWYRIPELLQWIDDQAGSPLAA